MRGTTPHTAEFFTITDLFITDRSDTVGSQVQVQVLAFTQKIRCTVSASASASASQCQQCPSASRACRGEITHIVMRVCISVYAHNTKYEVSDIRAPRASMLPCSSRQPRVPSSGGGRHARRAASSTSNYTLGLVYHQQPNHCTCQPRTSIAWCCGFGRLQCERGLVDWAARALELLR